MVMGFNFFWTRRYCAFTISQKTTLEQYLVRNNRSGIKQMTQNVH